jgi:ribonuclease HII
MRELDGLYPQYGFRDNMGYGTAVHLAAIDQHGPSPVHRRSFAPVRELRLPGIS